MSFLCHRFIVFMGTYKTCFDSTSTCWFSLNSCRMTFFLKCLQCKYPGKSRILPGNSFWNTCMNRVVSAGFRSWKKHFVRALKRYGNRCYCYCKRLINSDLINWHKPFTCIFISHCRRIQSYEMFKSKVFLRLITYKQLLLSC